MLAFCEHALLWLADKDFGDSVEDQQHQWFEGREGVGEVYQSGDKDE